MRHYNRIPPDWGCTWPGQDFCCMHAQLSFFYIAQQHRNFRETFAKVSGDATLFRLHNTLHTRTRSPSSSFWEPRSPRCRWQAQGDQEKTTPPRRAKALRTNARPHCKRSPVGRRARAARAYTNSLSPPSAHRNFRATFGLSAAPRNFRKNFRESLPNPKVSVGTRCRRTHEH